MANVTVTFTITEFCLHTGISEEELNEIVGLGVVEPREIQETTWVFDDHAAIVVQRAVRLRHELPDPCRPPAPQAPDRLCGGGADVNG